jgi:hypothetical protein
VWGNLNCREKRHKKRNMGWKKVGKVKKVKAIMIH